MLKVLASLVVAAAVAFTCLAQEGTRVERRERAVTKPATTSAPTKPAMKVEKTEKTEKPAAK